MSRNLKIIGLICMVICLSFVFMSGCAKEQVLKEETLEASSIAAEKAAARAEEDALAKEQEAAEKARMEKEQVLKEAASFADIRFEFDKYDLKPEARETLRKHANWLLAHVEFEVIVEGHCDERGTREYNLALGERRAESARDYLVNLGVDNKRLTTISYGEELPLDPSHTESAWEKNRRCHFVVVTEGK